MDKSQIDATVVTLSLLGPKILDELPIQNFCKKVGILSQPEEGGGGGGGCGLNESQVFVKFSKNGICIRNVHKCDET